MTEVSQGKQALFRPGSCMATCGTEGGHGGHLPGYVPQDAPSVPSAWVPDTAGHLSGPGLGPRHPATMPGLPHAPSPGPGPMEHASAPTEPDPRLLQLMARCGVGAADAVPGAAVGAVGQAPNGFTTSYAPVEVLQPGGTGLAQMERWAARA